MLFDILLHIIKLKMTYSRESHHYDSCNQLLTNRASTQPISRKHTTTLEEFHHFFNSLTIFLFHFFSLFFIRSLFIYLRVLFIIQNKEHQPGQVIVYILISYLGR